MTPGTRGHVVGIAAGEGTGAVVAVGAGVGDLAAVFVRDDCRDLIALRGAGADRVAVVAADALAGAVCRVTKD